MENLAIDIDQLVPISKLTKDLKVLTTTMGKKEVEYFVKNYYVIQETRKRIGNQLRAAKELCEPVELLDWYFQQYVTLENQIKKMMDNYSLSNPVGAWSRKIVGIGPVIAAGLLSYIDIKEAPYAGNIWSFAGLIPGITWGKGEKRPWNADLKSLCYKIGESFVKTQNNPNSFYGPLFVQDKQNLIKRNEAGEFIETALEKAEKVGKNTEAYKSYSCGRLPPGHIHAMARRQVVKLFLSHWHEEMYEYTYKSPAPVPYIIAIGGHTRKIERPQ